jgi:hypothetical protein
VEALAKVMAGSSESQRYSEADQAGLAQHPAHQADDVEPPAGLFALAQFLFR